MAYRTYLGLVGSALLGVATGCGGGGNQGFEVGDSLDGGEVTNVTTTGSCQIVTVTHSPVWACSAEQLELVKNPYYAPLPSPAEAPPPGGERVDLVPTDCEGLAALRRPALKQMQQQTLDSSRLSILQDKCLPKTTVEYFLDGSQVSYCANDPGYPTGQASGGATSAGPGVSIDAPANEGDGDGASEYSTTNTQVVGVDEADFVKNDAEHVYVLSSDGLHVIDAWPATETKEIAHVTLPGEPRRMFLDGDRLVVYTRLVETTPSYGEDYGYGYGSSSPSSQGCTYGYNCRFSAEAGHTLVIVYDVSNPARPSVLRHFEFSGGFVAARRVGPFVYTVVQDGSLGSLPGIDLTLSPESPEELDRQYTERRDDADRAVDEAPAGAFLPWVERLDSEQPETIDSCDNALAAQAAQGTSFVSLVSFDLSTLATPTRTLIAGKPGFVYASAGALYLATDGVDGSDTISYYGSALEDRSTVHKFALDGVSSEYRGSSAVPGHVLNQFSMDEQDGVLRMATSSGWVPDPSVSSSLLTLSEQDGVFQLLGSIGGIAPTEDIRSVRFDGTRAFVVTFKKTDPLFVFDLTDAAVPSMLGELKIPGFSTYMHPMDQNHLLAIGFDADDHGDFAYFDGIQLQIFDVSELSNPLLLHKTTIGTRGSASEALTNHLAFNYFPSNGMLAMPMSICEGGDDGVYGDTLTFSGLMVFDVSLETGITEHGRMPFVTPESVEQTYGTGYSCSTWWANSTSDVKRSIFMDDYAVGISDTLYQVAPLSTLSDVVHSLSLVESP